MTITCSPNEIISDVIDLLKEFIRECCSYFSSSSEIREKYRSLLQRLVLFEREYIEQCYVGGRLGETVLSWIRVAKLVLSQCIETSGFTDIMCTQIEPLSILLNLYGMDSDQILKEVKKKTDLSRRIKELYLTSIEDKVERLEDDSLRLVLRSVWSSIEPELRRAVEKYAVDEKLVELALRIEMLREKGLNFSDMLIALIKSEIKSLISDVQNVENKRTVGIEDTGRIIGSLRKLIELVKLVNKLGFSKSTAMDEYVKRLESLANQMEQLARFSNQPMRGLLGEARKALEEMRSLLD